MGDRGDAYPQSVVDQELGVDNRQTQQELETRGLRLEYITIVWNAVEMFVSIGLGIASRSLALVAFGLDTMVELFASGVVVWHLRHPGRDNNHITAQALRMVAGADRKSVV